jgi:hypothetical protein
MSTKNLDSQYTRTPAIVKTHASPICVFIVVNFIGKIELVFISTKTRCPKDNKYFVQHISKLPFALTIRNVLLLYYKGGIPETLKNQAFT